MKVAGIALSTLLSQTLVAFTIELDNAFEQRSPHHTTDFGPSGGGGPWLVSAAMWWTCMRFLTGGELDARELVRVARTQTNFDGMRRWGYIAIGPAPQRIIRATAKGREAQRVWQPLFAEIEDRWLARFGAGTMERLRQSLAAVAGRIPLEMPDCLPILGYGLFCKGRVTVTRAEEGAVEAGGLPLPILLSKVLLAFALQFETESKLSLAIGANVLPVLSDEPARVRDLPRLTGVSKEAIAMALGFLAKTGHVLAEQDASRVKTIVLTPKGIEAKKEYLRRIGAIEQHWLERFGTELVAGLRMSLETVAGDGTKDGSPLFDGIKPPEGCWRAKIPAPQLLPHFPMILHRGGYPDGS